MEPVLNLASEPFRNLRPVRRVALAMWVIGGLLLVSNAWLYWSYFTGSADGRERLAELAAQSQQESAQISDLESELNGLDLDWQGQQVNFLNTQIEARTFSWGRLLERVVEVLPAEVRLNRLDPEFSVPNVRRVRTGEPPASRTELVRVALDGMAKSDDELLKFVDALYEHPSFSDPNLLSESRKDNEVQFRIQMNYLRSQSLPDGALPTDSDASGDASLSTSEDEPTQGNATSAAAVGRREGEEPRALETGIARIRPDSAARRAQVEAKPKRAAKAANR